MGLSKVHPGAIVLPPGKPMAEALDDLRFVLRSFDVFENKLILFDRATQAWAYWPAEARSR